MITTRTLASNVIKAAYHKELDKYKRYGLAKVLAWVWFYKGSDLQLVKALRYLINQEHSELLDTSYNSGASISWFNIIIGMQIGLDIIKDTLDPA